LSGLYSSLEKVCNDLSTGYRRDGRIHDDDTLKLLADSYDHMADGLKSLSKLVHKELRTYDHTIIQSTAILTDDLCWLCTGACAILIGLVTCGPLDYILPTIVCGLIGVPTGGIGFVVCEVIAAVVIGAICEAGLGISCYAICENANYCGIHYIDYVWSEPINSGYVCDDTMLIGESDGGCAWIVGPNAGDGGNIAGHLSQVSSGGLNVWFYTDAPSYIYVHVSFDNYEWQCVFAGYESTWGAWGELVLNSDDPYNYVAVSAYSPEYGCDVHFDSVSANY
jgi:hypothetical protein